MNLMKNLKKVVALVLCLVTVFSVMSITAFAANYTSRYSNYNSPENSGDWAQYKNSKVQRSSSTTKDEVRWMQAALNHCMIAEGLNVFNGYNLSKLDVDGSFGPASKKATEAFQKAAGLSVDGSFGPATIKKMKSILSDGKTDSLAPVINRSIRVTSTTSSSNTKVTKTLITKNILQWDYKDKYWNGSNISRSGCGIVSAVSAVYNCTGNFINPNTVADWANSKGYYNNANVSGKGNGGGICNRDDYVKAFVAKYGSTYGFKLVDTKYSTVNNNVIKNHLANGGTAIVHVYGHYMCLAGYDKSTDRFLVYDPSPGKNSDGYSNGNNRSGLTSVGGDWKTTSELTKGNLNSNHIYIDWYCLIAKK